MTVIKRRISPPKGIILISAYKNSKMAKYMIFEQKMAKQLKIFENFSKKFFFKIDSESFEKHFKTEISKLVFCSKLIFCRLRLSNFALVLVTIVRSSLELGWLTTGFSLAPTA